MKHSCNAAENSIARGGPFAFFVFLGRYALRVIGELGAIAIFFSHALLLVFRPPFQVRKVIEQTYFIGVKSILIISLIGLFTGMVLGLQGYYSLVKFGSEGMLGAVVTLSLVRELGPVLSALMLVGRAGSSMAAELGIMRISEQIDALDTMDINPVRFLISPRLAASLISFPLLNAIFIMVGIAGGFISGVLLLGVNPGIFFARIYSSLTMTDVNECFIKSLAFAAIVATISCYQGYFTHMRPGGFGAKGVSLATTSAVVISSVLVLCADYVITSILM
jgi:phospholipid/cholesterol/gamma-HCH transport system permease protein